MDTRTNYDGEIDEEYSNIEPFKNDRHYPLDDEHGDDAQHDSDMLYDRNLHRASPARTPFSDHASNDAASTSNDDNDPTPAALQAAYRKAERVAEPVTGRQRGRQGDYESLAQEVLKIAFVTYKSYVSSIEGYPDKLMEKTWAMQAWYQAAGKLDIELSPNAETIKIVSPRTVHDPRFAHTPIG